MTKNNLKCHICKSSRCKKIASEIREGKYEVYKCLNCEVEFIKDYKEINYSKNYKTRMFKENSSDKLKIEQRIYSLKNTHKFLEKLIKRKNIKNILEIGPGMGMTSNFLKKKFPKIRISAHEIDLRNDKFLSKINYENIYRDLKDIKKNNFDLIFCIHLIEHIINPHIFLKNIRSLLNNGGYFFAITPNTNNIYFKTLPKKNMKIFKKFFYHVAHPFYYNVRSLSYLLNKYLLKSQIFTVQEYSLKNYFNWYINGSPSKDILDGTYIDKNLEEFDFFFKKNIDNKNYGSDIFSLYTKI